MTASQSPTSSASPRSTAPARRVLVLGAAGRFGRAAVDAFAAAGWEVIAQARRDLVGLPPSARVLRAPLDDVRALVEGAAGAQAVVYAVNPPYTQWRDEVVPLARHAMDVAEALGAVFVLPGNVYNYGTHMPARLGEETPQHADTVKGRIRVELEQELRARAEAQGARMRAVVVRAGDFFGGGAGSWFDLAIARDLPRGKIVYPGPLDVPHAWAFLPDLAQACVRVVQASLDAGTPAFRTFHFEGHTLTGQQLLDALERVVVRRGGVAAGRIKRGGMPWALFRVVGLVSPMWREILEMAYLWSTPHALDGARLAALGPTPHTPIDEALDRALDALPALAPARAPAARAA